MSKLWIGVALVGAAALVYFAPEEETATDSVSQPARMASGSAPAGKHGDASMTLGGVDLRIQARDTEQDLGNLFGAPDAPTAVAVEKKQRVVKAPPPPKPGPPTAPPLPFQFLGRWIEQDRVAYFLQWNERNLVVHVGETIDRTYKLEQGAQGQLTFVYLPLNQKQSMAVGDVN